MSLLVALIAFLIHLIPDASAIDAEYRGVAMPPTAGSRLKQLREMAGLSQYQLATLAEIGRDKLSRFECGYCELSSEEWQKLERAIDKVEKLQKALWPRDTFVDFDEGLNTAI